MPANLIHLVRHGEVYNPDGILYGRLPGFHLSELGQRMAAAAADELAGHPITALYASPLQRAQESAAPWGERFGLEIVTDDRLIEPTNRFEGEKFEFGPAVLGKPRMWRWVINPWKPSWGEPYASVIDRMMAAPLAVALPSMIRLCTLRNVSTTSALPSATVDVPAAGSSVAAVAP